MSWFDELVESDHQVVVEEGIGEAYLGACRAFGCIGIVTRAPPSPGSLCSVACALTSTLIAAAVITAGEDLEKGDFVYQENGVVWRR